MNDERNRVLIDKAVRLACLNYSELEERVLGAERVPLVIDTYQRPPTFTSDRRLMLHALDGLGRGGSSFHQEWRLNGQADRQPIDKAKRKKKNKQQRKARRH